MRRTRCQPVLREEGLTPPALTACCAAGGALDCACAIPPPPSPPLLSHVLPLAALTMLLWQDSKIEGFDPLAYDHADFPELLRLSYELEFFALRRRFVDHARGVARTDRERRAIGRADRAILRDSWADLAARHARLTAKRESIAATIDQSGASYLPGANADGRCHCNRGLDFEQCLCRHPEWGIKPFEINDRKSWPVVLPAEVRDKLFEIEYLDERISKLRRELQLHPTAAERNVSDWPWE